MDYEVKTSYEVTEKERQFCNDPAFYVWDAQAHQLVATITANDREIRVFCDGEMRLNLWESKEARERGDDPEVIRYCDRLMRAGIDTDEKLQEADDAGRIEWINNSWFDLYTNNHNVGEDGWLDCVCDTLSDAIEQATLLLSEDEVWGEDK